MSLKLRRLADDRIYGNTLIVKIAEAGGFSCPPSTSEIIFKSDNNARYLACLIKIGDKFVQVNRNLSIKSNVDNFNFEAAKAKLLKSRKYAEKLDVEDEDRYEI